MCVRPFPFSFLILEIQLQRELDHSRPRGSRDDLSHVGGSEDIHWICEAHTVEGIEEF